MFAGRSRLARCSRAMRELEPELPRDLGLPCGISVRLVRSDSSLPTTSRVRRAAPVLGSPRLAEVSTKCCPSKPRLRSGARGPVIR